MNEANQQAGKLILFNVNKLAQDAVDRQYEAQPEVWKPYKETGYAKSIEDAVHNFTFLAHSVTVGNPDLFLAYVAWLKVLFVNLKFPMDALQAALDCMMPALSRALPPELARLANYYIDIALDKLPNMSDTVETFLQPNLPLHDLATFYHNALLNGDRRAAGQAILEAVNAGTDVKDIYLHIFQVSQNEVGRLWQLNRITVAHEHYCSIATQMIMSQLYPYIFSQKKSEHRLVATSVGGELHEMGMRMVADFLEMDGWDTYYLGANTPTASIIQSIRQRNANLVAISVTMVSHLSNAKILIERIHDELQDHAVKVMIGGYPFNIDHDLWKFVGANGFACNAQDALSLANQLVINSA